MNRLSQSRSAFFDLIRWSAALIVIVVHTHSYAQSAGKQDLRDFPCYTYVSQLGHQAVTAFFVLSGYVVAFATARHRGNGRYSFRDYVLDRWSRIYSVLPVAIVLTIVLDALGSKYSTVYHNASIIPQDRQFLRIAVNFLSAQGLQGYRVQLGSNPALWSVGYEFVFYLLFGIAYFRKDLFRHRAAALFVIGACVLVIGLKMSSYFLIWSQGVVSYFIAQRSRLSMSWLTALLFFPAFLLADRATQLLAAPIRSEWLADFLLGLFVAAVLAIDVRGKPRRLFLVSNSFMAEFSYSIYAFHMPVILFWYAVIERHSQLPPVASACIVTIVCLVVSRTLYYISERQRPALRRAARTFYESTLSPDAANRAAAESSGEGVPR